MPEHPSTILLFAAGLGTRMSPLTNTRPKPLVEVAGKPLLDHALAQCEGMKAVVNAHYFADQIYEHLEGTDVLVSDESDQLLETGGGLKRALPLLDSNPVFTMNTDAVWRGANPIRPLKNAWRPEKMDALLLMIPTEQAVGHTGSGDFDIDDKGRLSRGSDYVYSGVQIICTDGLAAVSENAFSMWTLWDGMLANGKMYGTVYDGQWCDVGRPDSIPIAETMLAGNNNV
ncbi:nucleotidyltransferase family protein [Octadecabacter ascidiaceicola]|uniref:Glucose-1-phosphate cytidylyltransferase n=1 Tax=Octadecabacter ascidiaceicola TaxID=1655543 RepID=A0A238KEB6_9RHOB|nr:nucleotidyltransferase family protein [Octadecabacter ascidiaceicola]SMX41163.1 Glucose-1-phosphate cytidylyltransferase [Octadecabacter ascidiaceicola]